jgi:hypothetical protein
MKNYLPTKSVIKEEQQHTLTGVPVHTLDSDQEQSVSEQHIIEFETALMALEPLKKIQ